MRSLLFAGATRPDLVAKLPRSGPDAMVVDLEDAVPASHKEEARPAARELAERLAAEAPGEVYIRVNAVDSPWFAADVAEAVPPGIAGIVLPKLERPDQGRSALAALAMAGLGALGIVGGIETARGVWDAREVLALPLRAVYFGAEDYIADVGGRRTPGSEEVLYARSHVALAARVAGIPALDQVVTDVRDDDAFRRDAARGRDLGYTGKLCIHPAQVALAHAAFGATPEEVERARALLAAHEEAARDGVGAASFDGVMIDEPALRMARDVLARAGES